MKNEVRPICKSRASNRLCVSCKECNKTRDSRSYFDKCPLFRWNPYKFYGEDADHGERNQAD